MNASPASLLVPGHFVRRCVRRVPAIVLASAHSGRAYPPGFLAAIRPDKQVLRRAEDAWVDRLFLHAAETLDLPFVTARWGRAFIDLNRDPAELDPAIVTGAGNSCGGERVRAGLGVLPRLAVPGVEIYRTAVSLADAQRRIDSVHRPYHDSLARLLRQAQRANGVALLLDCHSMPPLKAGEPRIVIGDRFGSSAAEELALRAANFFAPIYATARNRPYAGGFTTTHHGCPDRDIHALQIEIDRSLYMNVETLEPHGGLGMLSARLLDFIVMLERAVADLAALPAAAE